MNFTSASLAYLSAGIGAGLCIVGAGNGIGKLAASAMDGIARQPAHPPAIGNLISHLPEHIAGRVQSEARTAELRSRPSSGADGRDAG